MTTDKFAN